MIYKIEKKNTERIIICKADKKYIPLINTPDYKLTIPLSVGEGKKSYKPIVCKFNITEGNLLMKFALSAMVDQISAIESVIMIAEQILDRILIRENKNIQPAIKKADEDETHNG